MLKKSSQEPIGQFQPNLLGGWGFRYVKLKGLAHFGVQNKENFDKYSKIFS